METRTLFDQPPKTQHYPLLGLFWQHDCTQSRFSWRFIPKTFVHPTISTLFSKPEVGRRTKCTTLFINKTKHFCGGEARDIQYWTCISDVILWRNAKSTCFLCFCAVYLRVFDVDANKLWLFRVIGVGFSRLSWGRSWVSDPQRSNLILQSSHFKQLLQACLHYLHIGPGCFLSQGRRCHFNGLSLLAFSMGSWLWSFSYVWSLYQRPGTKTSSPSESLPFSVDVLPGFSTSWSSSHCFCRWKRIFNSRIISVIHGYVRPSFYTLLVVLLILLGGEFCSFICW